jgi:hypothetical protein
LIFNSGLLQESVQIEIHLGFHRAKIIRCSLRGRQATFREWPSENQLGVGRRLFDFSEPAGGLHDSVVLRMILVANLFCSAGPLGFCGDLRQFAHSEKKPQVFRKNGGSPGYQRSPMAKRFSTSSEPEQAFLRSLAIQAAHLPVNALDAAFFFQCGAPVLLPFQVSQLPLHLGITCEPRFIDSGTGHGAAWFALMAAVTEAAILR